MSLVNLEGTHTPAKKGGEALGYQGRKKCKTINMLILTDCQGVPVGWSRPISGDYNDSFELRKKLVKFSLRLKNWNSNRRSIFKCRCRI